MYNLKYCKKILQGEVDYFIRKYKEVPKEYEYLKTYNYNIAIFYILKKLHNKDFN